jgi:FtsP/CotA-like multicopper oxidase with cupredoxin domain
VASLSNEFSFKLAGGGAIGMLVVEDLEGDLPKGIYDLPAMDFRVQFLNMTYLQYDYATGTAGSYVPLCQQFCLPVENRANCSEHFFENGPLEGAYNTTISPDGLEYETTLVNGVEQPTFDLIQNQWYRIRILYVPTRFRTMEPAFPGCEVKLLAKDGMYMLETPRDVDSGFMTSGSRADFLVRCANVGVQEFRSLSLARNSSNWIGSQKRNSLDRVLAYLNVEQASQDNTIMAAGYSNPDEIIPFAPARPCYIPDMINVEPDMTNFFIMSGLVPAPPLSDPLPINRPACCANTSYYDINGLGSFNIAHRGEYPDADREFDFELQAGSIWDVDVYASQIHPAHWHVNSFQLVELPVMGAHADYFQIGDFHDILHLTIADSMDYYGKAKLRFSIADWTGPMLGHCHIYRHSDRGMAYLGNVRGEDGMVSPKVEGTCYSTFETRRGFVYVGPNAPSAAPSGLADTVSPTVTPTMKETDACSSIYNMNMISSLASLVLFAAVSY